MRTHEGYRMETNKLFVGTYFSMKGFFTENQQADSSNPKQRLNNAMP